MKGIFHNSQLKIATRRFRYLSRKCIETKDSLTNEDVDASKLHRSLEKLVRFLFQKLNQKSFLKLCKYALIILPSINLGAQNFAPPKPLPQFSISANIVPELTDFDQDGDLDIAGVIPFYTGIFIENEGTPENYNFQSLDIERLDFQNLGRTEGFMESVDIDNDGDLDMLSVGEIGLPPYPYLMIYENLGNGVLEFPEYYEMEVAGFYFNSLADLSIVDFDDDGDFDILTFEARVDLIPFQNQAIFINDLLFIENIGQNGENDWIEPVINPFGFEPLSFNHNFRIAQIEAADFDQDGDVDIIFTPIFDEEFSTVLMYAENKNGTFNIQRQISGIHDLVGNINLTSGDLDNDGDIDLVYEAISNNADPNFTDLFWLENIESEITNVAEANFESIKLLQNPVSNLLNCSINTSIRQTNSVFEIYDLMGQALQSGFINDYSRSGLFSIDVSMLANGVYYLNLRQQDLSHSVKFIKMD